MDARSPWNLTCLIDQIKAVCEITPEGCWLWRYGSWAKHQYVDEHKYPRLMIGGVRKHVSRWVMQVMTGEDREDMEPCHSCDHPACVAPAHLHWGTHKENMMEMSQRERSGPTRHPESQKWGPNHKFRLNPELAKRGPTGPGNHKKGDEHFTRANPELITWQGTNHYRARLDPDKVRTIRAMRAQGHTIAGIASFFGVGFTSVQAVLEGRTWKSVK